MELEVAPTELGVEVSVALGAAATVASSGIVLQRRGGHRRDPGYRAPAPLALLYPIPALAPQPLFIHRVPALIHSFWIGPRKLRPGNKGRGL